MSGREKQAFDYRYPMAVRPNDGDCPEWGVDGGKLPFGALERLAQRVAALPDYLGRRLRRHR